MLAPQGCVGSGEVRGGAPATREFALLDPTATVQSVDAVVMTGGSAFGLAACDGVSTALERAQRGVKTKYAKVPIVVGMALYDLGVGAPTARPLPQQALALAEELLKDHPVRPFAREQGAGCGATVGKWNPDTMPPASGGLCAATIRLHDLYVGAVVAVNSLGWPDDGQRHDDLGERALESFTGQGVVATNTTLAVICTNAKLSKIECHLLAQGGHDGLARAIYPAHTPSDGDAVVTLASGEIATEFSRVRLAAMNAVVLAIRTLIPDDDPRPETINQARASPRRHAST